MDSGKISKPAGEKRAQKASTSKPESRVDNGQRLNVHPSAGQRSLIQSLVLQKKKDLPHLYGLGWYAWAKMFFESRNRMNLLCAGNQASKSSTLIRKNIEWACNKKLWKGLWKTEPKQFWYFYPTLEVATIEFEKKWVPEFMPRGDMKHHEWYGWDAEYSSGELQAIHFRSGVTLYFKTYGQRIINLQTASVHMVSGDEELPENYVDELLARLAATEGYFNLVFTATQGYQLWYRAMECIGLPDEAFKTAFKLCVSLYDCQTYVDGTPGFWTLERIKVREGMCSTPSEVQKRIQGRFVREDGKKYQAFTPDKLHLDPKTIPKDWKYYAGVDIGSGGGPQRSSGAIIFLAVNPEFTKGRVVKCWRGDFIETTASDILQMYRSMRGELPVTQAGYDYASREFGLIASRSGENFMPANKARESGDQTVNSLFAHEALTIDRGPDSQKLVTELMSIPEGNKKSRAYRDDLSDALRYAVMLIPWDFAAISPSKKLEGPVEGNADDYRPLNAKEYAEWELKQRRGESEKARSGNWQEYFEEIDMWNEQYGS